MGKKNYIIDPELQYCPQCRDEYRAGVALCAACGIELLSGARMLEIMEEKNRLLAARSREISEQDELVDILKGKVIDIKSVQSLLKREGFPSLLAGDSSSCCPSKGCRGGEVRLQVRRDDLREVMEIMAREHMRSTGLPEYNSALVNSVYNPEAGTATCPACGCTFSSHSRSCPDCGLCF
jgi:hypothetical protein